MSPKRAGFQAGANLIATDDMRVWARVEAHAETLLGSVPDLRECEAALPVLANPSGASLSKAELERVVRWKHTVGVKRVYNLKHLNANTDDAVRRHSKAAIAMACAIDRDKILDTSADTRLTESARLAIRAALEELGNLKGVGPATASAVLSLVRPDVFCYMYDEAIDAFEPQRDYKVQQYLRVDAACLRLAQRLGHGWTTRRVARAIWTAARFLAIHGEDLTQATEGDDSKTTPLEEQKLSATKEASKTVEPERKRQRAK